MSENSRTSTEERLLSLREVFKYRVFTALCFPEFGLNTGKHGTENSVFWPLFMLCTFIKTGKYNRFGDFVNLPTRLLKEQGILFPDNIYNFEIVKPFHLHQE